MVHFPASHLWLAEGTWNVRKRSMPHGDGPRRHHFLSVPGISHEDSLVYLHYITFVGEIPFKRYHLCWINLIASPSLLDKSHWTTIFGACFLCKNPDDQHLPKQPVNCDNMLAPGFAWPRTRDPNEELGGRIPSMVMTGWQVSNWLFTLSSCQ